MRRQILSLGYFLVFFLIVFVLIDIVGAKPDHGDPIACFITYSEGEYCVGDEINFSLHVFNHGIPADCDRIKFKLATYSYERNISVNRSSVGLYYSTPILQQSDLNPDGTMHAILVAEWNFESDNELRTVDVCNFHSNQYRALHAEVFIPNLNDHYPSPGQEVDFQIWMWYMGELVNADDGFPKVRLYDSLIDLGSIGVSHISTGIYDGSFLIDENAINSLIYQLRIDVSYSPNSSQNDGAVSKSIVFNIPLTVIRVWTRFVEINNNSAIINMGFSELDNTPMSDVKLSLTYSYNIISKGGSHYEESKNISTISDENGIVTITLYYEFSIEQFQDDMCTIFLHGEAIKGQISQQFSTYLQVHDYIEIENDLEVPSVELLTDRNIPDASSVQLSYRINQEGIPPFTGSIIIYIVDRRGVYYTKEVVVDENKTFTIVFESPEIHDDNIYRTRLWVWLQLDLGTFWSRQEPGLTVINGEYNGTAQFPFDPSLEIDVDYDTTTGIIDVTLTTINDRNSNQVTGIIWGFGSHIKYHWESFNEENWYSLSQFSSIQVIRAYGQMLGMHQSNTSYNISFGVPSFTSNSSEFYIIGFLITFSNQSVVTRYCLIENITLKLPNTPPDVSIESPVNGSRHNNLISVQGYAFDTEEIVKVEIRIDMGPWIIVDGTSGWSYRLNLSDIAVGPHSLEARAFDGIIYSNVSVNIIIDRTPIVNIKKPVQDMGYPLSFKMFGTSYDNGIIESVEIRFDDGEWITVNGTDEWSYQYKSSAPGNHTLECRSYDGYYYSDVIIVEFHTYKMNPDEDSYFSFIIIVIVILIVLSIISFNFLRR